jgi:demethylmenaquinone methyltransferase/2-methoxy-6-polyprenyl-1,4-benzoquinol methylase
MFAQIAPHYDRMNHLLSLNIDKRWRAKTVRLLGATADNAMLDVCTGTGDLAFAFAKTTDCPKIVGADFCAPMLQIAREKQQRTDIPANRLTFLEADATLLPFEDDSFSLVTVGFGLRNVSDVGIGLREMLRVCKRGKSVGVLEFSKPTFPVLKQGYSFYFRHVLPRIGQFFAKNNSSAYEYLPESVSEFPSGGAFLDLMKRNGYVNPRQHVLTFGVASLYIGDKP